MSDTHSNVPEKLSDLPLEHLSDFDWNRCPIWFRTGVRHELESLSDLACSTHWGGGQPDNGTGGVEFYAHMWPAGSRSPAPGKWNDYGNADDVLGFPLYGVAEISPASVVQVSLPASLTPSNAQEVADSVTTTTSGPELHVFTAVELCWASEANKAYQVQW